MTFPPVPATRLSSRSVAISVILGVTCVWQGQLTVSLGTGLCLLDWTHGFSLESLIATVFPNTRGHGVVVECVSLSCDSLWEAKHAPFRRRQPWRSFDDCEGSRRSDSKLAKASLLHVVDVLLLCMLDDGLASSNAFRQRQMSALARESAVASTLCVDVSFIMNIWHDQGDGRAIVTAEIRLRYVLQVNF